MATGELRQVELDANRITLKRIREAEEAKAERENQHVDVLAETETPVKEKKGK